MTDNKKDKLSLKDSISNAFFACKIGTRFSKSIVIHSFFLWVIGYMEWVFFDGVFMRVIVNALDQDEEFRKIFVFILCTGLFFCLASVYKNYVNSYVYPLQTNRLFGGIYKMLYRKARNVELRCYEDSDFYNKYTMAMDGCEEKVSAVIRGVIGTFVGAVAAVIVFYMMFDIDHYAVLFIISPLIGNFVFENFHNKVEFKKYQEQAPNDKVLNYVNRMIYLPDGAKEIRLSEVFRLLRRQYRDATDKSVKVATKYAFANASLSFWRITFTFTVMFEGVLLYAIYRNLVSKTISLAQLTIMSSLMVAATWILIRLFENIVEVLKNGTFIRNLRDFLEYKETIPEDYDGEIPDRDFQSLEFKNVSFSYKKEETIKNLSFKITKGQIAALVGHNGAGKTTIIKLLLRLYDPTEGEIIYNGKNIKSYNLALYRELFATTFQDFMMFGMSIKDNVLMGREYPNEDELVISSLKKAGVYDKVCSLDKGIDSIMTREFDDNGVVLSGGETQKIAVARTFAKDAPMKMFDEPSSALDPIAEYELFKNIMREGNNHTMLFISHRLSSVKNCDLVFMLENGRKIEEGSHEELMRLNGSYAQMYKKQAMNYLAIENEEEVVI